MKTAICAVSFAYYTLPKIFETKTRIFFSFSTHFIRFDYYVIYSHFRTKPKLRTSIKQDRLLPFSLRTFIRILFEQKMVHALQKRRQLRCTFCVFVCIFSIHVFSLHKSKNNFGARLQHKTKKKKNDIPAFERIKTGISFSRFIMAGQRLMGFALFF